MEADMTEIWRWLLGAVWAVSMLFIGSWKKGVDSEVRRLTIQQEDSSRERVACQLETQRQVLGLRGDFMEGLALINGKLSQIEERLKTFDQ